MPYNDYRPDLMGSAVIDPAGRFEAGSWQSFTLTYTAGKFGIDDQGGLKIGFRGHFDGSGLQTDDPKAPGFTTVEASNDVPLSVIYETRRNIRPWNKSLYIRCLRFLKEGDTLTIRFGDTREGSPGTRMQTFCESAFTFQVTVDPFATHDFITLPEDDHPTIAIVPGVPVNWKAVVPTLRRPGETFRLSVKAEDAWGNPSDRIDRVVRLQPSLPVEGLPDTVAFAPRDFARVLEDLSVNEAGTLRIDVLDETGNSLAQTNPLVIRDMPYAHYWSDMHGQSRETIGINTAREYFDFARNKSFVDICGHQGNDFQITDAFWEHLNELTAEFNEPGRFVTLPGYEWSGNTGLGGDHNVWYRTEGRPIYRSCRALVSDRTHPETDAHSAADLIDKLKDEDALVVAHVGGRYADIKYAHDANLEPSVEVHSAWGTFDWIVRDAFEAGYKVGIVASSDGHKGRPGASYPGDSAFGAYGGLTCHLLDTLDRDNLFDEFRKRHHYATTGNRMFLNVTATFDGGVGMMGDEVSTTSDQVSLNIEAEGSAPIERIDIFDGLDHLETIRPWAETDGPDRLRITCAGQHYRGRGRLVKWTGKAALSAGKIERIGAVNFWNPNRQPALTDPRTVDWQTVTTGGSSSVDLWLDDDAWSGDVVIETSEKDIAVALPDLTTDGETHACGGMDIRLTAARLPGVLSETAYAANHEIPVQSGREARLYVRITQEDGHQAWSSPIYITRS